MDKIVEGIHQFQKDVFSSKQQLFEGLADGQHPRALFITCSDSRIDPSLLTQTEPGELFLLRNAGNIIPPYGTVESGEAATIEYAVSVLGIKTIVVCGHSHCGAMGGLLNQAQLEKLPAVKSLASTPTKESFSSLKRRALPPFRKTAIYRPSSSLLRPVNYPELPTFPVLAKVSSREDPKW